MADPTPETGKPNVITRMYNALVEKGRDGMQAEMAKKGVAPGSTDLSVSKAVDNVENGTKRQMDKYGL